MKGVTRMKGYRPWYNSLQPTLMHHQKKKPISQPSANLHSNQLHSQSCHLSIPSTRSSHKSQNRAANQKLLRSIWTRRTILQAGRDRRPCRVWLGRRGFWAIELRVQGAQAASQGSQLVHIERLSNIRLTGNGLNRTRAWTARTLVLNH